MQSNLQNGRPSKTVGVLRHLIGELKGSETNADGDPAADGLKSKNSWSLQ
jgi:hypothetical protein